MIQTIKRILAVLRNGDDPKYPLEQKLSRIEQELRELNGRMEHERRDRTGSL